MHVRNAVRPEQADVGALAIRLQPVIRAFVSAEGGETGDAAVGRDGIPHRTVTYFARPPARRKLPIDPRTQALVGHIGAYQPVAEMLGGLQRRGQRFRTVTFAER